MAKFLDLCSGIGAFRMAAERLAHQCVGYVEFDKYPRKSYEAIYDTTGEWTAWDLRDVTNDEWKSFRNKVDFITCGFPCQAFSVAGKGLGFQDIRGTVFFEVARAIEYVSPQYFILENVKNLISHDNGNTIETIIRTLNEIGYTVDYNILNSKYFNVPQNRERVFIVGIKEGKTEKWKIEGNHALAKSKRRISSHSWAKTFNFDWPQNNVVTRHLIDILEDEKDVPPNLYLSSEKVKSLIEAIVEKELRLGRCDSIRMLGLLDIKGKENVRRVYDPNGISPTLTTMSGGNRQPKVLVAGNINPSGRGISGKVYYAEDGISPTITAGNEGVKIILYKNTSQIKDIGNANPSQHGMNGQVYAAENSVSPTFKGEGIKIAYHPILNPNKLEVRQNGRRMKDDGEEMFTLTTQDRHGLVIKETAPDYFAYIIRKLTPKECWRLQAFPDWAYERAAKVNSASQLYKQAGNSLTVNVAYEIIKRLIPLKSRKQE